MVHSESLRLGCVCPQCGARCDACLGTDTVISRDTLKTLKTGPWIKPDFNAQQSMDAESTLSDMSDSDELYHNSGNKW